VLFKSVETLLHSVKHRLGQVCIATFFAPFLYRLTLVSYMAFQVGNVPIGLS